MNVNTPMPPATQRAHFRPTTGDSLRAIARTARKRPGRDKIRALDLNLTWVWADPADHTKGGAAVGLHWPDPGRNGYGWIKRGTGVRRMTRAELRRQSWALADVLDWRRGPRLSSEAPHTYGVLAAYARRKGVVLCGELKSQAFATDQAAAYLVAWARAAGHPAWFMALLSMRNARGKCEAVVRAGGQFALIFGRARSLARKPPADWPWSPGPTRIWGPARWPLAVAVKPAPKPPAPAPTPPAPAPAPPKEPAMPTYRAPSPMYLGPTFRSSAGNNKPINRIVIHSTVSPCEPGGARRIAAYFRSKSAGGSAHYVVDPGEVVQTAYDSVIAWHAPPNRHSLGIEMCDMPAKTWARWARPRQRAMLKRTARLTAELCLAYDVPARFLTPADLKAGKRGITTHANVSQAFRQSTHWDPGSWPRFWFMRMVRAQVKEIQS